MASLSVDTKKGLPSGPLEPIAFSGVPVPIPGTKPDRGTAGSGSSSTRNKPPIMPRKKSLKSSEDDSSAAGQQAPAVGSAGMESVWRKLDSGTSVEVGGAGKEADYLEVVM